MSIATTATPARQAGSRAASQAPASPAARPSTCPSRPWTPDRSTNPVCHRVGGHRGRAGLRIDAVAGPTAAGLIDAQRGHWLRLLGQQHGGLPLERGRHGRPGQPVVTPGLRDRPAADRDRLTGRRLEPGGDPRPRRQLRRRLGERAPPTALRPTAPPPLAPHQPRPGRPGHVPGPGHHPAPRRDRRCSARRAHRLDIGSGGQMHHPAPVGRVELDPVHHHTVQPQQQRRIVVHARALHDRLLQQRS
jgi:hypothetical protein